MEQVRVGQHSMTPSHRERAAIILAGGEGARLRALTHRITGHPIPKQFCAVLGDRTLIEQTRTRVALSAPPEHTMVVVNRAHHAYYHALLDDMRPGSVVVQPQNRETAPAILYGLMRLRQLAPDATVAIFPSDHFVSDDRAFARHVEVAFEAVENRPELAVLLAIAPSSAEPGYGWIEPAALVHAGDSLLFRIAHFWEKPAAHTAQSLLKRGCLWNSFVMIARVSRLLRLIRNALPSLSAAFDRIGTAIASAAEEEAVAQLYRQIPPVNFSKEVLERFPENWALLPVRGVEWSDLGEPSRVYTTMARAGISPHWNVVRETA